MRVLVAGATGYVGGRLVPRLISDGHEVRCLARSPEKLSFQPWRDHIDVVAGDVLDEVPLKDALNGCDVAVYLIHSTAQHRSARAADAKAARLFAAAADEAGIDRIVYLSSLAQAPDRSAHAASRHDVGRILADGGVPVAEIRAGMILGSGSLAFDMLGHLTDASPLAVAPRWVRAQCQPVGIADVLDTLGAVIGDPSAIGVFELGGPQTLSYRDLMRIYTDEAGLRRRRMLPLPVSAKRLSARWAGLVTPLHSSLARPIIDSLATEPVVGGTDQTLKAETTPRVAIQHALSRLPGGVITRWSDATSASLPAASPPCADGTVYMDRQVVPTHTEDEHLYWAFSRIGGSTGYYGMDWAWRIRGLLDQMVGGVGLRRGRRHPLDLKPGEGVDFWRVEEVVPGVRVRLRAEMRVPGNAWLEWEVRPTEHGGDLVQTSWFQPRGVRGKLYWYGMLPAHRIVFPRMARGIAAAAEERAFTCR